MPAIHGIGMNTATSANKALTPMNHSNPFSSRSRNLVMSPPFAIDGPCGQTDKIWDDGNVGEATRFAARLKIRGD